MIKAVIFDMDGVIIDSEMVYLEYLWEYAKTKKPDVGIEELYGTVGTTKKDCWVIVEAAVANGESWEELRAGYMGIWDNIFEKLDYQKIFRPEILTIMDWLRDAGYPLAVASSTGLEQVKQILTVNHVAERLELMVSGNDFKRSKPDPDIYFYTAEKLGVKPEECLVIEDSTVGITAASSAGMHVAALIDDRFSFDRSLAEFELKALSDIIPLVEGLKNS